MSAENLELHVAICEYLQQLAQNPGKLDSDSIQVALQCLTESLEIDMDDCAGKTLADKGTCLDEVFTAGLASVCGDGTQASPKKTKDQVTDADKQMAEQYKGEGNALLSSDLEGAFEKYSKAIELNPFNHIYWNNRAVVQFKLQKYAKCVDDAKESIKVNDNYSKSHYRLGLALVELKKYNDALAAFGKAKTVAQANNEASMVTEIDKEIKNCKTLKSGGGSTGGQNAAGAAGGNPFGGLDFGALMNNPMIAQMAQSFMSNMGQNGGFGGMGGMNQQTNDSEDEDYDEDGEDDAQPAAGGSDELQRIMREVQANPMAAMQYLQNPEIMQQIQAMLGGGARPQ